MLPFFYWHPVYFFVIWDLKYSIGWWPPICVCRSEMDCRFNLNSGEAFVCSCRLNLNFDNWNLGTPYKKQLSQGVKLKKKLSNFFLRLHDTYEKYTLQKEWVKTTIPALSSDQSNLQTPIWGRHCQLDDQNRNPNINNRDHLVGQLTSSKYENLIHSTQYV